MRKVVSAAAIALPATVAIYFANQLGGRHWFDVILLGPLLIAGWASGNLHQPSEAVFWAILFALMFLLSLGSIQVVQRLRTRGRRTIPPTP